MLNVIKILDFTIPLYGNKRIHPYGHMIVSDGITSKRVPFGYKTDRNGFQVPPHHDYFTFNRKRYGYKNVGSLYYPKMEIKEYAEG